MIRVDPSKNHPSKNDPSKNDPSKNDPSKKPWHLIEALPRLDQMIYLQKNLGGLRPPRPPRFITAACKLFWVPFLPIFACRGGPGRRRRGQGPPRHANIDFCLCLHGPLRKYFRSVFSACADLYENIFEAFFLPARTITKHF